MAIAVVKTLAARSVVVAYDSARPQLIPPDPPAVFPYSDGQYAWSHKRFPQALYRYITVRGDPVADIADFEWGCVWPATSLTSWADERVKRLGADADLTVYTDRDNFKAARQAMAAFTWHLFLATLDDTKPLSYMGKPCRAVQYTDRLNEYDMSVVYEPGWLNKP